MHVISWLRRRVEGRKKAEKGATVVLVSLLMVALLGMAAISIDFAVASSDKAQAQNAADAAALAIARECAVQSTNCTAGAAQTEVNWAISQNSPGKTGSASPAPAFDNRQITVTVEGARPSMFAQVFGDPDLNVGAQATAAWDQTPIRGTPNIPMGIGYCDWKNRKGTVGTPGSDNWYKFETLTNSGTPCTGVPRFPGKTVKHPSGQMMWFTSSVLPGFNLLSCNFSPNLWDVYKDILDTGIFEVYAGCDSTFAKLKKGDVILMPIYGISNWRMPWVGIEFPNSVAIIGFAPFKITDFRKNGLFNIQTSSNDCRFPVLGSILFGLGNCTQIKGQFVRTARPYEGWEYGNTFHGEPSSDLGAVKVTLTQ